MSLTKASLLQNTWRYVGLKMIVIRFEITSPISYEMWSKRIQTFFETIYLIQRWDLSGTIISDWNESCCYDNKEIGSWVLRASERVVLASKLFLMGCLITYLIVKVKLATIVEGDPKAPFSIATTPRCRGGRYSIPWIAPLYPWTVPYNAEC